MTGLENGREETNPVFLLACLLGIARFDRRGKKEIRFAYFITSGRDFYVTKNLFFYNFNSY